MEKKLTTTPTTGDRTAAIISGLTLLLMVPCAGFSFGFVFSNNFIPKDVSTTSQNLRDHEFSFRLSVISWLFIAICDVIVSWSLHQFLKKLDETFSQLVAWFRLIYTAVFAASMFNLVLVASLLDKSTTTWSFFEPKQTDSLIYFFMKGFEDCWSFSLIIFGVHLFLLGILTFKSSQIPKLISLLVVVGGIGYAVVHAANLIAPSYKNILEIIFILPMFLGEIGFGVWLLVFGGKK
jgi:hypothetical protein